MLPKLITLLIVLVMIDFSFSPLKFAIFYILFRPLVQPYATEHYTLFAGIQLTGVFALVLIAYSALTCCFRKDYTLLAPNIIFFYLLVLFSSLSFLHTLDYIVSIAQIIKIITATTLYALVYSVIKTTKDARKVIWSIVVASIIPMLIGYYQFFAGVGGKGLMGMTNRATGGLGFPNMYGIFLALCFCAGLMLLFQKKALRRFVWI